MQIDINEAGNAAAKITDGWSPPWTILLLVLVSIVFCTAPIVRAWRSASSQNALNKAQHKRDKGRLELEAAQKGFKFGPDGIEKLGSQSGKGLNDE